MTGHWYSVVAVSILAQIGGASFSLYPSFYNADALQAALGVSASCFEAL